MAVPEIVQTKIDSYINNTLRPRYPQYYLFRISDGYVTSSEADADTTYTSYVYSDGVDTFETGNFSFTNISQTTPFAGGDLWYHAFSEDTTDLEYSVQISNTGEVLDQSNQVTIFILSDPEGTGDPEKVCILPPKTIVYNTSTDFRIGSYTYTDSRLTRPFVGKNGYYNVYDRFESPTGYFVQISSLGEVLDKINCE
jgi:hypothetical protein